MFFFMRREAAWWREAVRAGRASAETAPFGAEIGGSDGAQIGAAQKMGKLQGVSLEFTHFLTAKTHPTPMNKGRGAFSQVKWAFFRERVSWRRGSRCRSAEFEVLRASRSAFRRLQQRSASNSSLNPGRNSVSSFPVGPGSGSTVMRRHFPNRVKARLRPSAIA